MTITVPSPPSPPADAPAPAAPSSPYWEPAARELVDAGVRLAFGIPGDDMLAVAALRAAGITLVTTRTQNAAVLMARPGTGEPPGVVVLGRGPGAAAAVGALLEARDARIPLLVLVGGMPEGRQDGPGFQNAPLRDLLRPVSAHYHRVERPEDTQRAVRRALHLAGALHAPAVLELPDPDPHRPSAPGPTEVVPTAPSVLALGDVAPVLAGARRPVVLAGAGAAGAGGPAVLRLARALGAPVLSTASGRGIVDERDDHFLGLAGLYAHPGVQDLLSDADLLVSLGSRLEETATTALPPDLPVLQVNTDPAGFSFHHPGWLLSADCLTLTHQAPRLTSGAGPEWGARVARTRQSLFAWRGRLLDEGRLIPSVLHGLAARLGPSTTVCHENGLSDIWSYLFPVFTAPGGPVFCPSEQTTLGAGCSVALGVAARGGDAVAITGDGALARVYDDVLALAGRPRGRLLYVVLDNGGFGWLEQMHSDVTGHPGGFLAGSTVFHPAPGVDVRVAADAAACARALDEAQEADTLTQVVVVRCGLPDQPPVAGATSW